LNEYNAYFGRTPPEEIFNGLPSGFKSRGGDEKVTIGIWIWSEPLIVRQNGEEIAILLVDAQGNLDNSDKRSQSSVFFAISSMISDVFIYNIFHEISDDLHTQFVEMFLDFTKHFQDNKMDKFQTLLMLVRDFKCLNDYALGYYDRKTKPDASPANYMINKLCPSKCLEEKRSSRQAIENNYKHVAVFLAAFPGVAIYFDQFKGDPIQIEPHFKESVKCLLVNIFNPPIFEVKKIAGEKVNGFKFLNYIMKWAELLENAPEPIVFNLAKAYAEVSNRNLVDKLLEKYKSFLNEYKKPVDEELLKKEHEKNLNDCFEVFDKEWKLGSLEILEKFKKILEEEIEIRWRDLRLRNRTKSEAILKKRSQKALKEYNIEMSEFCSTAQDENELIEKHDKILISHFQTYDNELKLGSEKMRSEFMKQFKEKSTLNLNNYKTRNEIKSTEALIKL
jgi:atlastin